jgi:putative transposase
VKSGRSKSEVYMATLEAQDGYQLQPGTQVEYLGTKYVIKQFLDLKTVLAFDPAKKKSEVLWIRQLRSLTVEPQKVESLVRDLHDVSDEDWQIAQQRFEIIRPLLEFAPYQRTVAAVQARAEEFKKGVATLYRWIDAYSKTGRISSLLPEAQRSDFGKGRLKDDTETILKACLEEWLKARPKLAVQDVCDLVKKRCDNANLTPPHPNTVRNRVRGLSEKLKLEFREGKRAARQVFQPITGQYPGADFPLAVVQIDHTKLDIILVDDLHRRPVGRPWITLAIDVFSRMVFGFYVSFDNPSANSVGLCLSHAILPKDAWLSKHDIPESWPCWGLPRKIFVDNGKEFRGKVLERGCIDYGIDLEWRPPLTPEMGGHIERLIGTVNKELHKLPGTTFSNPKERGEYQSEKSAILTLTEFELHLTNWIAGVYHQRLHSKLKTTPLAKFEEGVRGTKDQPGTGLPDPNDPRLNPDRLRLDFMPFEERSIQKYGVQIDNIIYQGEALYSHIRSMAAGQRQTKRKFIFRRDPRDISKIYFYDPDLKQYFIVPYRDATQPAISVWELRETLRWMNDHGIKQVNDVAIFQAYARMSKIQEQAKADTIAARRKVQRKSDSQKAPKPNVPSRPSSSQSGTTQAELNQAGSSQLGATPTGSSRARSTLLTMPPEALGDVSPYEGSMVDWDDEDDA